ncbi:MBG domain-containing protein [uncultured Roseobacter sp.]|uniref:two-partner secretion domain-containing protein n=1 Tax=uncultured Roseobacter sp. TaxID=114847 RepID=UPI002608230E|nr:MBG domain-containing protein [uncultured Roseobacter sp.]
MQCSDFRCFSAGGKRNTRFLLTTAAAAVLALASGQTNAQSPQGGVVASGAATISQNSSQSVISQTTQRAIIDWQSFDVGKNHTVTFDQPGRSSATLNRVQSVTPSLIQGTLTAPGTIVIQNTAGVVFSGSARVDAGGLVAASQRVDPGHFMASGNFRIGGGERHGARVLNEGEFTIGEAGLAALVGTDVENAGVIMAHMGTVALASGELTTIDLAGDGVFQVSVDGDRAGAKVTQSGSVNVSGGRVLLTAGGAAGALDAVINTSGVIRASSGTQRGGSIELVGRGQTSVTVSGDLDVASDNDAGGSIWVLGETVTLAPEARLSADGATDGGSILVGGDVKGGGDLRRSWETRVAQGARLSADGADGDGGKIVVWSDGSTWFDGAVSASGGIGGGFVETSGRINLDVGENADVSLGSGGQWLLDPRNVTIVRNGTDIVAGTNNPPAGTGDFRIRRNSVLNVLNAGSDVTITTDQAGSTDAGNITLASALRWNGAGSLTLDADAGIFVNQSLQTRGAGNLTLNAGDEIQIQRDVQSRGTGNIQMTALGDVAINRNVQTFNTGNINIDAGGNVDLNRSVFSRGAGNVEIRADGLVTVDRGQQNRGTGRYLIDAGDRLVINRSIQSRGEGDIDLRAQNDVVVNQNVISRRGGDLTVQSRGGDVIFGGSGGNQVLRSNSGRMLLEATTGSVLIERTNAANRNTQVYSNSGDLDIVAGTEIRVQGGTGTRQLARLGRTANGGSDISLTAPLVTVRGGDGSNRGHGQILAGRDGSISIDADTLIVSNGAGGARGQVQALNGASLTLDAASQTWDGFVRGTGDTTITGDVTATVRPRFDLNAGSDFRLVSGSFQSLNQRFDVRTTADAGAGGMIRIGGPVEATTVLLQTDAGVQLDRDARITGRSAGTPVVVAAGPSFRNDAGADVLQTTRADARWLLYIDTFAGLSGTEPASGQFDLYNRPYATTRPRSLRGFAGNRIVYGEQPTLTLTATSLTKTYGQDATGLLSFSTSGLRPGDSEATALTAPASVSSTGAVATAPVAGSPYAIVMSATASNQGYNLITNDGTLTIDPAALTIAANDASRDVGAPNPVFTETVTGFVLGESLADLAGSLTLTTAATPASPAGFFAITPGGVTSSNYAITFADGTLTVGSPAPEGFAVSNLTEGGVTGVRRAGRRAYPLTPGDAAFRTTERDAPLAQAGPFALTYSLGEVVTFAPAGDAGSQGFVPAAGGAEDTATGSCGVAANIGTAPRAGCVSVVRSENYWEQN